MYLEEFFGFYQQYIKIGLDNGIVLNRQQGNTWKNIGQVKLYLNMLNRNKWQKYKTKTQTTWQVIEKQAH